MFNVRETQHSKVMYIAEEAKSSGNIQEVAMGDYLRVTNDNNTVLHTIGLSDCSAIIAMSGWNGRYYEKRSLAHLVGGCLSYGLINKNCDSFLDDLRQDLKDGGEIILVNGSNAQTNCGISIVLGQEHAEKYPLVELISNEKVNTNIVGSNFVEVHPDGKVIYNDDSYCRGMLSDEVKNAIINDIYEDINWQPVSHHPQKESQGAKKNEDLQKGSSRSLESAALKNVKLQERSDAEAAHGDIVRVPLPQSNSAPAKEALLNDYRLLLNQNSPLKALEAITALATAAVADPSAAASVIRAEIARDNNTVSRLSDMIAKGGIAPLAGAWIDLLHLLYKDNHLSGQMVVKALLPHCAEDKTHSIAHALAGAAWDSEATTKLCALLSEVAGNDRELRQEIIKRFSLKQSGYGFRQLQLDLPADLYKRAKRADSIRQNEAAKAQLKQSHLIPENRELFRMTRGIKAEKVSLARSFEALENEIKAKITPRVEKLVAVIDSEKALLERAKISAKAKLDEINIQEQKARNIRKQQAAEAQEMYIAAQENQYMASKYKKIVASKKFSLGQQLRQHEKNADWKRVVPFATVLTASAASKQSSASSTQQLPAAGEHPQDKNIQERLDKIRSFRKDYELEQRWGKLRSFVGDLETARLQERFSKLRGSNESRRTIRKTLAPPLKSD